MKIGFPAAGLHGEHRLFMSNGFLESGMMGIYDTQTDEVEVVSKESLNGGLLAWVTAHEVNAIITPSIEAMAFRMFKSCGINVYKAEGKLMKMNVNLLFNKVLLPYAMEDLFGKGGCSPSSCQTCKSGSCS